MATIYLKLQDMSRWHAEKVKLWDAGGIHVVPYEKHTGAPNADIVFRKKRTNNCT